MALLGSLSLALLLVSSSFSRVHPPGAPVSVIVRTEAGATAPAVRQVLALGGRIERSLDIISGFAARIDSSALPALAATPGVAAVTPNAAIQLFSIGGYDPSTDVNSLSSITQRTGAQSFWRSGYTGRGVDVALIDSGVAPVDGLTATGKVVLGPDISFDSQYRQLSEADAYGHGTHIAGIIAGRDNAVVASQGTTAQTYAGDTQHFIGMAPDARIVSVKVGDHTGAADVSQVIAAIDWVVQHRSDNGLNIKVLNLSFGTDSVQSYTVDPLAHAAEQAWLHGLVVVASVGNGGSHSSSVADPAADPYVIAVGAADTNGSLSPSMASAAMFSSIGNGTRNPDLAAPGVHIASLRDPGSFLDTAYGATATVGGRYFRGSGTSQATAIVSGAAALVLSQHPGYTPDQVKHLLVSTATALPGVSAQIVGHGELNLSAAMTMTVGASKQSFPTSSGTGSLQAARGSLRLTGNGVSLTGDVDIFGNPFNSKKIAHDEAGAAAWSGGTWNHAAWAGTAWSGSAWSGSAWSGSAWSGSAWSGSAWSGSAWSGSAWSGSAWSGSAWSGSAWSGSGWSGSAWSGSAWSGSAWSGSGWFASVWC